MKKLTFLSMMKSYFCFEIFFIIVLSSNLSGQSEHKWVDISLNNTGRYVEYSVGGIGKKKYPAQNLFDADLQSCWVSNPNKRDKTHSLYLKTPALKDLNVNVFPGYGKSKKLFNQNSRPKKLKFSIYAAVNPEGHVSEVSTLYKAIKTPYKQTVNVSDSFEVQSFKLNISEIEIAKYKTMVQKQYNAEFDTAQSDICLILKIEIIDVYPGTKYKDVCISEIFFNDCLISFHTGSSDAVKNIYLNKSEDALLVDYKSKKGAVVHRDKSSVLQIIEISADKRWAIVLSMPKKIEGRVSTTYLLVDIANKKIANSRIKEIVENYSSSIPLFFKSGNNGILYLVYAENDKKSPKLKLRSL
ncbi:MAG: hypothetical protein R6W70_03730 [bacterium]